MTVTPASFRADFPEFADVTAYPDSRVTYYLNLAALQLLATVWKGFLDNGTELFVAHNLVLARQRAKAAANGSIPGQASGVLNSKAVDKVSAGYDANASSLEGAGEYNLTTYGLQFVKLMRLVGMQGVAQL